jgi:hypothetical protein
MARDADYFWDRTRDAAQAAGQYAWQGTQYTSSTSSMRSVCRNGRLRWTDPAANVKLP